MENKNLEELKIKLTVDTSELEDTLKKLAVAGFVANNIQCPHMAGEAVPLPVTELKEGIAEIQHIPQMPEEKEKLVKMLLNGIEFLIDRAQSVGLDNADANAICTLSAIVADMVK